MRDKLQTKDAAARGAAYSYLRLFALTLIAALWGQIVVTVRDRDGAFYDVKRKLARFYMQHVLPETESIAATIVGGDAALEAFTVEDFAA